MSSVMPTCTVHVYIYIDTVFNFEYVACNVLPMKPKLCGFWVCSGWALRSPSRVCTHAPHRHEFQISVSRIPAHLSKPQPRNPQNSPHPGLSLLTEAYTKKPKPQTL